MIGEVTETINGIRGIIGERVHAVGYTGLPNMTVGRTRGTIITVGKIAGMILVEGLTPTVMITGEGIIRPPRKITTNVPDLVVIFPPLSTERVT